MCRQAGTWMYTSNMCRQAGTWMQYSQSIQSLKNQDKRRPDMSCTLTDCRHHMVRGSDVDLRRGRRPPAGLLEMRMGSSFPSSISLLLSASTSAVCARLICIRARAIPPAARPLFDHQAGKATAAAGKVGACSPRMQPYDDSHGQALTHAACTGVVCMLCDDGVDMICCARGKLVDGQNIDDSCMCGVDMNTCMRLW